MHSQLYLSGTLQSNPEILATRKGRLMIKALLATVLIREIRAGEYQSESITLPITFFSGPVETVKSLRKGDQLAVGCHLYGSQYEAAEGTKYGCQLIADQVFTNSQRGDPP